MSRFFLTSVLALLIVLTACSVVSQDQPQPVSPPLPTRASSPLPTRVSSPLATWVASPLPTPGDSSRSNATVRAAINDFATKLKIAPEKIQVVSVEEVDWPDTSMGCPQPGMFYAQVIVQGYRIVLAAEGKQVVYHADRQGHVGTCPKQ